MVLANDSSGRQQNQRWPLPALQSELAALEAELASGKKPHVERLQALEGDVKHWAGWFSDGRPAPRFARILLRAGQPDAARRLLEYTHRVASDGDGSLSLLLVNATASCGDHASALKVLQPLVQAQPQNPALLGRAAELACKIGQVEDGLAFYARASSIDTAWRGRYLAALIAAERAEDALAEARAALRHTSGDTALCFASLRALWRFGNDRDEVARARSQFLAQIPPDDSAPLWRARMHKCAQDYEAALAELHVAHRNNPQDPSVLRERAEVALLLGHWGRDASAIAAAAPVCDQAPELAAQIARADRLLRAFGGSLASASEDPSRWSQLRSPESVFEIVAARRQPMLRPAGRGLVMIAHSLTAGGAERIVANIFRRLREEGRFDWVKLYLVRLSAEDGSDFYLPLTGIARHDVVVLDRDVAVEEPFAYLSQDAARTAQAIRDRLLADRPAVVHLSLEPLTLYGGLAALEAGVPRIVLHTHNMRPTSLFPDSPIPPRWRDCYAALLKREEVRLVCCARAAMGDYAEWLGIGASERLTFVHNGSDFDRFRPADEAARAQLRAELGFAAEAPVVGTAFKFREEKRPILWIEAACAVLERRPDARFVLFGDGPLLPAAKDAAAARGAGNRIVFAGLVDDLHRRLPLLDLFLLTSSSEALPNVLLEAQAAGVPVVAPDVGGISETMIAGETGLLVRDEGADAYASAILRALDDPAWRRSASHSGTEFIRKHFSPERMMANMCAVLLGEEA